MTEQEFGMRCRELAKDLLDDLGIKDALKAKYKDSKASQGGALIFDYAMYYRQAYELFLAPDKKE